MNEVRFRKFVVRKPLEVATLTIFRDEKLNE